MANFSFYFGRREKSNGPETWATPGTRERRQVPEKVEQENGRARITRGEKRRIKSDCEDEGGRKAVRGKRGLKKKKRWGWGEEPGMDINEQEEKTEKGQRIP